MTGNLSLDVATAHKAMYSFSQDDFHDIVVGNNGYKAGPGYDLVTGRGSPKAERIVHDFIDWGGPAQTITRRRRHA